MFAEYCEFQFDDLANADLIVNAVYKGGEYGNVRDDPLGPLMYVGNQGGFRAKRTRQHDSYSHVVLYSSLVDPDWPDRLDTDTSVFTYYGDNKTPGRGLHNTPRGGNRLLRYTFRALDKRERAQVPPFFIFTKGPEGRDVVFRGLAAPGASGVPPAQHLIARWYNRNGEPFQNYRATFTVLNAAHIRRAWLHDLAKGQPLSGNCPEAWLHWVETGEYVTSPAIPRNRMHSGIDQLPTSEAELGVLRTVYNYFAGERHEGSFERFVTEIVQLMDSNITYLHVVPDSAHGVREVIGQYRIGLAGNEIQVEFVLEAQCHEPGQDMVGVRDVLRFASKLRDRQFGVLVTTSLVTEEASRELIEGKHPIVIITGRDIARVLQDAANDDLLTWLTARS